MATNEQYLGVRNCINCKKRLPCIDTEDGPRCRRCYTGLTPGQYKKRSELFSARLEKMFKMSK